MYVIFPGSANLWRVFAVPLKNGFELRLPLPESWRGLTGKDLIKVTGIQGSEFVHANGWVGVNATRENAIKMAEKALSRANLIHQSSERESMPEKSLGIDSLVEIPLNAGASIQTVLSFSASTQSERIEPIHQNSSSLENPDRALEDLSLELALSPLPSSKSSLSAQSPSFPMTHSTHDQSKLVKRLSNDIVSLGPFSAPTSPDDRNWKMSFHKNSRHFHKPYFYQINNSSEFELPSPFHPKAHYPRNRKVNRNNSSQSASQERKHQSNQFKH